MFLDAFTQILDGHCPPALVRAADAAAAAPLADAIAAAEFDRVLLPEAEGGAGLSLAEFAPLVMACGRYLCPVEFPEQALARWLGIDAVALPEMARAALVAARMAGAIERMLELTIAHVTTRQQFGRPLSAFQAIQQQLAQFAEEAAAARLAAHIGLGGPELSIARSATAKLRCNEAAGFAAATAHQLHGAIGATAEYDLQLYSRALWRWQRQAGSSAEWAMRLGQHRLQQATDTLPYLQQHLESGASA